MPNFYTTGINFVQQARVWFGEHFSRLDFFVSSVWTDFLRMCNVPPKAWIIHFKSHCANRRHVKQKE